MYIRTCTVHALYLVKGWRELRVNQLEEKVPERFDLIATSHMDTARPQWGNQTKVGPCQGKEGKKERLLDPRVSERVCACERQGDGGGEGGRGSQTNK